MKWPDKAIVEKIKMVIFDIDGVFTDGSVFVDSNGNEILQFSRIDGKGIELLNQAGIVTAVISSEDSEISKIRMEKLKIKEIHLGIKDKLTKFSEISSKYSINEKEICYCGDDIQDIPVLRRVGLSCCPKNAQSSVKEICLYSSELEGGKGFVREVCNRLLESRK
jgi:YrbI family 3-deoxy-D-manno-octulosonate 8-phosphate phosphatase